MMWLAVVTVVLLWLLWRLVRSRQDDLSHIPGPQVNIWWDLVTRKEPDRYETHREVTEMAKVYGPVFKIPQFDGTMVFLSGFEAIYEVMVKSGKDFAHRDLPFRLIATYRGTGIFFQQPDQVWKNLRKSVQCHFKQFGEGMSKLEEIIVRVSDEVMFSRFAHQVNVPFAPKDTILKTAIRNITFLICGELSEEGFHHIIAHVKEFLDLARLILPAVVPISFQLVDAFPWVRYFGIGPVKLMKQFNEVVDKIWTIFVETNLESPGQESLIQVFRELREDKEDCIISELDIKMTCIGLLQAGTLTTTDTFDVLMNILAHSRNVQDSSLAEIKKVAGDSTVKLSHRTEMHYTRATLFETLRYHSLGAFGVVRIAGKSAKVLNFLIPKGTRVVTNLYQLHNDPEFWGDPEVFRPERFLDERGEVVPADHKYRKHLMPFGAGPRVCLAESLAMSRLFLWLSTLVQRFEVLPAPGNHKSLTSQDNLLYDGFICSKPYEIILKHRLVT